MIPLIWAVVLITIAFDCQSRVASTFYHEINSIIPHAHLWAYSITTFYKRVVDIAFKRRFTQLPKIRDLLLILKIRGTEVLQEASPKLVGLTQFFRSNTANQVHPITGTGGGNVVALSEHLLRGRLGSPRDHHRKKHDVSLFALERSCITEGHLMLFDCRLSKFRSNLVPDQLCLLATY